MNKYYEFILKLNFQEKYNKVYSPINPITENYL